MKEFKGFRKLIVEKTKHLYFQNGCYMICADNEAETPIGLLPEPIGGIKGPDGLSVKQKANAQLFAFAPELLIAAMKLIEQNEKCNFQTEDCLHELKMNKAFIELKQAVENALNIN